MSTAKIFTRTIVLLGLVSLFTDISSEMLYPVMPVYLKSIGYSALWIGVLEGLAEGTAGLSKSYFGKLSDDKGRRMPFVSFGYFLSALSKPLIILFVQPLWIMGCRITDRLGKGIRTGARDAVLGDNCAPENRGKVFGFHRGMDTLGAAIGPFLALLWLGLHPGEYRPLFIAAFLPALIGVGCTMLVKEKKITSPPASEKRSFWGFLTYWKKSPVGFRRLVSGLFFFALFNSSDVFLLLMAKQQGLSDQLVIGAYVFYNLVYALFSYPFGWLGDKWGMKVSFCLGLLFFAITYTGLAMGVSVTGTFVLFFVYGLYAAATDGVSKAWISKLVPSSEGGAAQGFNAGMTSLATLFASFFAGLIWTFHEGTVAFLISAAAAALVGIYLVAGTREKTTAPSSGTLQAQE
jgi:MFS family permease